MERYTGTRARRFKLWAICFLVIVLCAVLVGCGKSPDNTLSGKEVSHQAAVSGKTSGPEVPPDGLVVNNGQVEPPDPFVVKNHPVMYGTKIWPKWLVVKEFPIYQEKDEKSPVVTRLVPGDIVQVAGSELWAHPGKLLVTKEYSDEGMTYAKGEVLYPLYRYEEDCYRVWRNGAVYYIGLAHVKGSRYYRPEYADKAWGEIQEHPTIAMWVLLTNQSGKTGWANFDRHNFEINQLKQPKN